jgi:hypothetical protein
MEDVVSNEFVILDLNSPNCPSSAMVTVKKGTVGQNGALSLRKTSKKRDFCKFVPNALVLVRVVSVTS